MSTKQDWANKVASECYEYMKAQDGGMSGAAMENMANSIRDEAWRFIMGELGGIKGGYNYMGACSNQICFPLKSGGELRFMQVDDECSDGIPYSIDLYDGALPPCITGPSTVTGPFIGEDDENNDQQTDA